MLCTSTSAPASARPADFVIEGYVDPREPLRDEGPSDVLDHATSEIASGSKLGIDATKKLPGEGFKRTWPPLIKMDAMVRKAIDARFGVAETKL